MEVISDCTPADTPVAHRKLVEAAVSLGDLQAEHERFREALMAAAGQKLKDQSIAVEGDGAERRAKSRDARSKSKQKAPVDFSAFTRARWEAERLKGASMLGTDDTGDAGGSSVKVWVNEMPKPFPEEKPCSQVKGRHIMINTVEKARKVYNEISVSGNIDRTGFVRGANLARFISLANERSDCPSAKKGGDMGWLTKSKAESKFNDVAFVTPRGACSPPFKSQNGFHMFFCEERKG
jgi:parvulin-like peptidyl-prolyl isomerase